MAINVNVVYGTVQAILNKEQRGYFAPSEFNKFAEQVQLEIYESYFYDMAHFDVSRKGTDMSIQMLLQEKKDIFHEPRETVTAASNGRYTLPSDLYRLDRVYLVNGATTTIVDKIIHKDAQYILNSNLTAPNATYPKYVRTNNTLQVYPTVLPTDATITIDFYRKPAAPRWAYISPGNSTDVGSLYPQLSGNDLPNNALYNPTGSVNFELHPSEQYLVIQKILGLVGIQIREADIIQVAAGEEAQDNTNKKT